VIAAVPGSPVAFLTHARHVPLADRERFAGRVRERVQRDTLLVETCHRVEAYLVAGSDHNGLAEALPHGGRWLHGEGAVRHAISLAVGLDSTVVGEDQVLHQLRQLVAEARRAGGLDPILDRLFMLALRAGRRARSWRQGPPLSLADAALVALEQRSGPLRGRPLLVVGAGEMGRLAARAARSAGAAVSVTSRTPARAQALAEETGAKVVPFDPGVIVRELAGVAVRVPAEELRLPAGQVLGHGDRREGDG